MSLLRREKLFVLLSGQENTLKSKRHASCASISDRASSSLISSATSATFQDHGELHEMSSRMEGPV